MDSSIRWSPERCSWPAWHPQSHRPWPRPRIGIVTFALKPSSCGPETGYSPGPISSARDSDQGCPFRELRARIAALRAGEGLSTVRWTDPVLTIGVTPIKGVHLTELRRALDAVYESVGRPRPNYTDGRVQRGCHQGSSHNGAARGDRRCCGSCSPMDTFYEYFPLDVIDTSYRTEAIVAASADLDGDEMRTCRLGADHPGDGAQATRLSRDGSTWVTETAASRARRAGCFRFTR